MKVLRTAYVLVILPLLGCGPAQGEGGMLKEIESEFVQAGQRISPWVVSINIERNTPEGPAGLEPNNLNDLRKFLGLPTPDNEEDAEPSPGKDLEKRRAPRPRAAGSGFIYDAAGHIITNNHVIDDAQSIEVRLADGNTYKATVIGQDAQTDIAVIKIDTGKELPAAPLGDSDALQVGQFAIAVGSPHNLAGSLSFGHISALGRGQKDNINLPDIQFYSFIQTDAAINLGNSGGPLCNIDGEVIGINTAIVWGAESLGFAIPINMAKERIVPELISAGKVTRGYLGVEIDDVTPEYADAESLPDRLGAIVANVYPQTPAERAGMRTYDIIRTVNGEPVESASDLMSKVACLPPGVAAQVEVWREGNTIPLSVSLDERPEDPQESVLGGLVLGMRVQELSADMAQSLGFSPGIKGAYVDDVEPDSPAYEGDIRPGDVIVEAAKEPINGPDALRSIMKAKALPGKAILVRVARSGRETPFIVALRVPVEAAKP